MQYNSKHEPMMIYLIYLSIYSIYKNPAFLCALFKKIRTT